jgi:DNA-binding response OmpR family regulator
VTKILIAEDDLMIADFLEEILIDAGYTVCGIATTVAEAVKLGNEHHPGLAILDLRLKNGDLGTKIVPLLTECDRVGVLYATGNDNVDLTQANGDICIRKPYQARELLRALRMVQQIVAGCAITPPLPVNIRLLA